MAMAAARNAGGALPARERGGGTAAADGRDRNSPLTSVLLSHLEMPLETLTLFGCRARHVRQNRFRRHTHQGPADDPHAPA